MNLKTVSFENVKTGNYIHQDNYYAQNKWREVTNIKQTGGHISLGLGTTTHATIDTRTYICGHRDESIVIMTK